MIGGEPEARRSRSASTRITFSAKNGVCDTWKRNARSLSATSSHGDAAVAVALRAVSVDQRKLAEDAARPDLLEGQSLGLDRDRALADDVHAVARVPDGEDDVAGGEPLDVVDAAEDLDRGGLRHVARRYAEAQRGR